MPKNMGQSVNAKLREIAKRSDTDMSTVQTRYALERLLWRFTQTEWADRIALKGALIFVVHEGDIHRPTSDIDLSALMEDGDISLMLRIVEQACAVDCEDGITFTQSSMQVRKEKDWSIPGGKIELDALIDTSRVRVRVDMGFGHAITPSAKWADYPSMIPEIAGPRVLVCPYETMISEKLRAMCMYGAETTRLRDYYDLFVLSQKYDFDGEVLGEAVRETFRVADENVPRFPLDGLSEDFVDMRHAAWDRFRNARGLRFKAPELEETVGIIKPFLEGCIAAADGLNPGDWQAGKGWEPRPTLAATSETRPLTP